GPAYREATNRRARAGDHRASTSTRRTRLRPPRWIAQWNVVSRAEMSLPAASRSEEPIAPVAKFFLTAGDLLVRCESGEEACDVVAVHRRVEAVGGAQLQPGPSELRAQVGGAAPPVLPQVERLPRRPSEYGTIDQPVTKAQRVIVAHHR